MKQLNMNEEEFDIMTTKVLNDMRTQYRLMSSSDIQTVAVFIMMMREQCLKEL